MAKTKGVSSKTHTQKQLDDYANQHNPNNKACWARLQNNQCMSRNARKKICRGEYVSTEWFCYSNPFDFD